MTIEKTTVRYEKTSETSFWFLLAGVFAKAQGGRKIFYLDHVGQATNMNEGVNIGKRPILKRYLSMSLPGLIILVWEEFQTRWI